MLELAVGGTVLARSRGCQHGNVRREDDFPGARVFDVTMADTEESFLICRVQTNLLALPLAHVVEVLRPPTLERQDMGGDRGAHAGPPAAVPGLRGLTLLRGTLTPVLDLGDYLGWAGSDPGRANAAHGDARRLVSASLPSSRSEGAPAPWPAGLLVDEVIGVQAVDRKTLNTIELPGGAARRMGRFDAGLAECLSLAGILPDGLLPAEAAVAEPAR